MYTTEIKQLRPDWQIAKAIAHNGGLRSARDWMRRPLIDLRGLTPEASQVSQDRGLDLVHRPLFNESNYIYVSHDRPCVLHVGYFWSAIPRGFVNLTFWVPLGGSLDTAPNWKPVVTAENYLDNWYTRSIWDHSQSIDQDTARHVYEKLSRDWFLVLDQFDRSNLYPVEVRPEPKDLPPKQARKVAKTRHTKPWLDERAPRVILLHPSKNYPEHGRGGSHASPRPHQRRGHWRTLQAERFGDNRGRRVWVKPAWIGPTEWAYKGNVYRVVT